MAVFYAAFGDDAPHLVERAVGGYYACAADPAQLERLAAVALRRAALV